MVNALSKLENKTNVPGFEDFFVVLWRMLSCRSCVLTARIVVYVAIVFPEQRPYAHAVFAPSVVLPVVAACFFCDLLFIIRSTGL